MGFCSISLPTALTFWPKAFPALFSCPDSLISHPFLNSVNANWLQKIQNLTIFPSLSLKIF
jgi:hypothetical protein